ncbi:hypothetical protein PFBG_02981 [Plasmodium falciparum 7G8]|nr:hypothetical protein PFBG_02981 [Plasmodium falciparum 7G8]EWC90076.1 hypothetical protein PFNF54_01200 [Plasmodium falciparum NF54]
MLIFLKYVDRKFLISIVLFFCSHTFVENYNIHKKRKTFILPPRLKKSFSYKPNKVINTFEIGLKADEELDDYKYFTEEEYIPPLPPVETWEDLILKEEIRNKKEDPKRNADDYTLTHESREKVLDIIRQTRLINHCNYEIQKNKQKNILYFVTPKIG